MTDRTGQADTSWLTLAETAERLRVSERTVQRYVADGRLTASRTPGRHLRFRLEDVDAALAPGSTSAGIS